MYKYAECVLITLSEIICNENDNAIYIMLLSMLMNRKNKVKLTAEVFSLYLLLPPMKVNKNPVEKIFITALKNVTCIYRFINRQNLFFLLSLLSILSYFPKNCRQYRAISCFFPTNQVNGLYMTMVLSDYHAKKLEKWKILPKASLLLISCSLASK